MKNITITNIVTTLAFATIAFAPVVSFANHKAGHQDNMKMDSKMGMMMTSSVFKGVEANGGTVSATIKNGTITLSLSADFKIPGTPAPSWQIVDSKGNTYLLNQLKIAGDKTNRSIKLPSYIKSVKTVQIWCSFAEVNLGEASFKSPIMVK